MPAARGEPANRIEYYTELHVGIGAPAEQTFSILVPSDQPTDPDPTLTVYIRPKGGIQGYDRVIHLDDIDKPTVDHPGINGSKLVLALTHDPKFTVAFSTWERYLKSKTSGALRNSALPQAYENIIFTRPQLGFMVKFVPADWYALSMVNMILIDRTPIEMTWTEENQKTIAEWVRAGGTLVLTGPPEQKQWHKLGLDTLAGVEVLPDAPLQVTDVSALADLFPAAVDNDDAFVNAKHPIACGRIRSTDDHALDVSDGKGALLYHERRFGAGTVVVIPWDIDGIVSFGKVPGNDWGRRDAIYDHVSAYMKNPALGPFASVNLPDGRSEGDPDQAQARTTEDLKKWANLKAAENDSADANFSSRLHDRVALMPSHWDLDQWLFRNYLKNSFEKQSPVKLPATSVVGGFLLLYLFLVSPLTYIVMRLLRRREWAWPIGILLALLFSLFSYGYFYAGKQGQMVCNEVSVVELGDGDSHGVAKSWLGLYSPNRGSYKIVFPDQAYADDAAYPLGSTRAVGSLMLFDRNLNLNLASSQDTGVNVTWNNLEQVMQGVYINDRSSQYFTTTNQVDFGAKDGGHVSFQVQPVPSSAKQLLVTVTNTTHFPILAPTLTIHQARYPLVASADFDSGDFRETVIPAGAKNFALRTDSEDLLVDSSGLGPKVPATLRHQVPKSWEESTYLTDRCVYLNALSSQQPARWERGNDQDALLIGWVNAPAVFIQVDDALMSQHSQYTGVMELVVRKPGWENAAVQETYAIGAGDTLSFVDDGHDPQKPDDDNAILPADQRNTETMATTQVKRYGGLISFWYERNRPLKPGTKTVQFVAEIQCDMPSDLDSSRVLSVGLIRGVSASGAANVTFSLPSSACKLRFGSPTAAPATQFDLRSVSPRHPGYLTLDVPVQDLANIPLKEKCHFLVELDIQGGNVTDDGLLMGLSKFSATER
ncbi:MAG: hypothetical protein ACREJ2_16070 [Planctomycetota bacterium]